MKVEDLGFIIFTKQYEENSMLVKILSRENGLISGYLKHTSKNRLDYQVGNSVQFTWSARSVNQLGSLKIEVVKSYLSSLISNRFYLNVISNIGFLINNLLHERYLENNLYFRVKVILELISNDEDKLEILKQYLIFKNILFNVIGTGIIFDNSCDIQDLFYVSPKTGLAVSKQKGEAYKDKLLIFPEIFKTNILKEEYVIECLEVLNFFLRKYLNENNLYHSNKLLSLDDVLL